MRRLGWMVPALVAVAPVLAMLVQQLGNLGDDGLPEADWAVLELATRNAVAGRQLTGAYSRWGFSHPGPAMFYWMAPFYRAAGESFSGLVVGTLVFHAVCLGAVVVVVQQAFGRRAAWVAAAVVALFAWRFGIERFRDPWNPYWVVAPLALLMVCAMAAWTKPRRWPLALAVAAATVAVQAHVGAAAVAAVLLLVAVAGTVREAQANLPPNVPFGGNVRGQVRVFMPAAVTGGVLWLLPVVQQVTGHPGNFAELYSYVRSDQSPHAVSEVGPIVTAGLAWAPTSLGFAFGPASPYVPELQSHTGEYLFVALTAVGLVAGAVLAWRRSWGMPWVLVGALPVAAAVVETLASLTIRDDVLPYLFTPVLAIALLWWLGCALYVGRLAAQFVPADWQRWLLPTAALVATLGALAGSGDQFDEGDHAAGERWERAETRAMTSQIDELCNDDRPVWIDSADTWVLSVPLGVALERCGVEVSFTEDMAYMVGDDNAEKRRPEGAVRLCVTPGGQIRCTS